MELFPAQPDLSLQISPPNANPSSGWRRSREEEVDLGFWKIALNSRTSISSMAKPGTYFDLSFSNSSHFNHLHNLHQHELTSELGFLKPIKGIPVYQNLPPFSFTQRPNLDSFSLSSSIVNSGSTSSSSYPGQGPRPVEQSEVAEDVSSS